MSSDAAHSSGLGQTCRRSERLAEKTRARHAAESASTREGPGLSAGSAVPRRQRSSRGKRPRPAPPCLGPWDLLPLDVVKLILGLCGPKQLAMLASTCRAWRSSPLLADSAIQRLEAIPRARGLPAFASAGESPAYLLHFISSQSLAAAQATVLAFGATHTCMLLTQARNPHHHLHTAGHGFAGQLGTGQFEDANELQEICLGYQPAIDDPEIHEEITPAVVACGRAHSACITKKGQLMSWGCCTHGQLGYHEEEVPSSAFPYRALGLTARTRFISLACGDEHTLAISEHGSVWACGRNDCGQLGLGNFDHLSHLFPVPGLRRIKVVSCAAGSQHSLALVSDGTLYSWGDGQHGQLGHAHLAPAQTILNGELGMLHSPLKIQELEPSQLESVDRITSVAAAGHQSVTLTVGGRVLAFGSNSHGQLGLGDIQHAWAPTPAVLPRIGDEVPTPRAVQVACGARHTLVLALGVAGLRAYATGANFCGQLGVRQLEQAREFVHVPGVGKPVAVQAGEHCSAAITSAQRLFVWGRNDCGQLGVGFSGSVNGPTLVSSHVAVHPSRTLRSGQGHGRRKRVREGRQDEGGRQQPSAGRLPALFAKYRGKQPRRSLGGVPHKATAKKEPPPC